MIGNFPAGDKPPHSGLTTTTGQTLLLSAAFAGVSVTLEGDRLVTRGRPGTEKLCKAIEAQAAEIIPLLPASARKAAPPAPSKPPPQATETAPPTWPEDDTSLSVPGACPGCELCRPTGREPPPRPGEDLASVMARILKQKKASSGST